MYSFIMFIRIMAALDNDSVGLRLTTSVLILPTFIQALSRIFVVMVKVMPNYLIAR